MQGKKQNKAKKKKVKKKKKKLQFSRKKKEREHSQKFNISNRERQSAWSASNVQLCYGDIVCANVLYTENGQPTFKELKFMICGMYERENCSTLYACFPFTKTFTPNFLQYPVKSSYFKSEEKGFEGVIQPSRMVFLDNQQIKWGLRQQGVLNQLDQKYIPDVLAYRVRALLCHMKLEQKMIPIDKKIIRVSQVGFENITQCMLPNGEDFNAVDIQGGLSALNPNEICMMGIGISQQEVNKIAYWVQHHGRKKGVLIPKPGTLMQYLKDLNKPKASNSPGGHLHCLSF